MKAMTQTQTERAAPRGADDRGGTLTDRVMRRAHDGERETPAWTYALACALFVAATVAIWFFYY